MVFDIPCLILTYKTSLSAILFSLLHSLDPDTATAEQLKEAFCRLVSLRKGQLSAICIQFLSGWIKHFTRDIDPKGLKLILAALLKEKQAEEVEREKNGGGGWKISGFSVLVILGIIGLHLFLMVCICCGVKRTCWTCRKARKGFKQVSWGWKSNQFWAPFLRLACSPKTMESNMNGKLKNERYR